MWKRYKYILMLFAVTAVFCSSTAYSAESQTWQLDKSESWKPVTADDEESFNLEVSKIKHLINTGKTKEVKQAYHDLKEKYPEVAGPDFDAFVKAELLLSEGNLVKAGQGYKKLLIDYPKSELYEPTLHRLSSIGQAFLQGEKKPVLKIFKIKGYAEGTKIMEDIEDRAGYSPIALSSARAVAKGLEKREKFEEAYQKWSEISYRWPTGEAGKEALLSMARCKHAAYHGPKYDPSYLLSAKSYYENFQARYPEDARKFEIDKKLKQIDEQLAYKKFNIAKYYQEIGNVEAANLYFQMVIDNWPGTTAAELSKRLIKNPSQTKKAVPKILRWYLK